MWPWLLTRPWLTDIQIVTWQQVYIVNQLIHRNSETPTKPKSQKSYQPHFDNEKNKKHIFVARSPFPISIEPVSVRFVAVPDFNLEQFNFFTKKTQLPKLWNSISILLGYVGYVGFAAICTKWEREKHREVTRFFFIFKYLKSVEKWGQIATTQSRVAISVGPVAPVPIGHATSNRTIRQTQRYKTSQMISKTFLRVNTHTQSLYLYLGVCANAV